MAQIKGKQLKDASIDIDKLSGIATDVAAGKLLLTAANQNTQALNLDGDISGAINATTYSLSVNSVQAGAVGFAGLASAAVISSTALTGHSNTSLVTSSAIKGYVDSQVSSGGTSFVISDGTNNDTVNSTDNTITFAGTANEVDVAVSATNTVTVGLPDNVTIAGTLTVTRNLIVSGTTTTINSTDVEVADAHLRLGAGTTTASALQTAQAGLIIGEDAAGISFRLSIGGDFESTQSIDLATGNVYKIANTEVLSANGAAKVQSGVASDGLTHNATTGALSSNGLTVSHHTVDAAITANNNITSGGANITVTSAGGDLYVGSIELKINGIAYIQGTDWSLDGNSDIVWDSTDFDLEIGDVVTLTYHTA